MRRLLLVALLLAPVELRASCLQFRYEPVGTTTRQPRFFLCDLETEFPASGIQAEGDLAYAKNTDVLAKRTSSAWVTVGGGGGTPGGVNPQVQFNDAGAFGGDAGFTYNKATDTASLGTLSLGGFTSTITSPGNGQYTLLPSGSLTTLSPTTESTGQFNVLGSSVSSAADAGDVEVRGGQATGSAFRGGNVTVRGGSTGVASTNAGSVLIAGGAGAIAGSNGGGVQVIAGNGSGAGLAGSVFLSPGTGTGTSGVLINGSALGGPNSWFFDSSGTIIYEGTVDANEATWSSADPTADYTYSWPNRTAGTYDVLALNANGFAARTGSGTQAARTMTAGTGISISNGDGVAGNPTFTNTSPAHVIEDEGAPLTQRSNLNFTGSGVTCSDSGGKTVCNVSSGGGGGNFVEVSLAVSGGFTTTTVTGQAWVGVSSIIICSPFGTTADGNSAETAAAAGFGISVSDRVAGTGFNLNVYSPNGAEGTFRFHCQGA